MTSNFPVLATVWRLLTFRATRDEMMNVGYGHLLFGLLSTWVVGMGRSWDSPKANIFQHLGVGSVLYVFALAFLLWITVKPIAPIKVSYKQILIFVTLVSPPAILYAIPVEMFVGPPVASNLNVALLCLVASWRVALLVRYLAKGVGLRAWEVVITTLLPLATIITPIAFFGLMNETLSAMSGLHDKQAQQKHELVTSILAIIGMISGIAWIPLLIAHGDLVVRLKHQRSLEAKINARREEEPSE